MTSITFPKPDDWHLHCREGAYLTRTVPDAAKQFSRALIMPNLRDPITHTQKALAYRKALLQAVPPGTDFQPLMTLYLTPKTTPTILEEAYASPFILAAKLYPAGVTTLAESGFQTIEQVYPLLSVMEALGMILCLHGETPDPNIDVFDRETVFIDTYLRPMIEKFPRLRIVLEHISTAYAVNFVKNHFPHVAATITAHHLWLNRNDLLANGIKPHYYCKPIVKRQQDQEALIAAAISGHPAFFLGTDSAPHLKNQKESACGCAGIYTAHAALPLYAEVFSNHQSLAQLPLFASEFGANFYGLQPNNTTVTLIQKSWTIPESLSFGDDNLIPFAAGITLTWDIAQDD